MASEDMRLVSKSVRQNAKSAYGYKELEKLVKLIPLHPVFLIIGSCVQENVHRLKWCMLYHCGWKRIVSFKVVNWIRERFIKKQRKKLTNVSFAPTPT